MISTDVIIKFPQIQQPLLSVSDSSWEKCVEANFDVFLNDHASAEKKASSMALTFVSHYPDKLELVDAMVALAVEELLHYQQVMRLLLKRNIPLLPDNKDDYVGGLRKLIGRGSDTYFRDRLLIAGIIEARGAERFGRLGVCLQDKELRSFYAALAKSESRHHLLFFQLALTYFPKQEVLERIKEIAIKEADLLASLPIKPALH